MESDWMARLLHAAQLPELHELLQHEELRTWADLRADRPALLRRLRRLGVARLAHRQKLAGAFATVCPPPVRGAPKEEDISAAEALARVGRLLLPRDPPAEAAEAAADAVGYAAREGEAAFELALQALGVPHQQATRARDAAMLRHVRLAFYASQLCERGTEVALYDYAVFAEHYLGLTPTIVYDETSPHNVEPVVRRFAERFGPRLVGIRHQIDIDLDLGAHSVLRAMSITHLYVMKVGGLDAPRLTRLCASPAVRVLVHAVFTAHQPHGDVYARVSPCVRGAVAPVVPHIVRPRAATGADLRVELSIPADATVFGRHGGWHTFDIPFAAAAVLRVAAARRDIYFVLMNTAPLPRGEGAPPPHNVIHLPLTADEERKSAFIRSCDAMLHARAVGETFGLAVAEFSAHGRPVITSSVHTDGGAARHHLDVLGERGLYYKDEETLVHLLLTFDRERARANQWNMYQAYEPARVMQTFKRVFLKPV
ncbi:hypothetical protein AB1Y20_017882 [Prymnesium parvum]|uniref:Digalactosyldiacylglycerol synthase n=1 Tax=Prymnesium parvum TaxID=97485 RepID=A0AB34JPZ6_PRYPA